MVPEAGRLAADHLSSQKRRERYSQDRRRVRTIAGVANTNQRPKFIPPLSGKRLGRRKKDSPTPSEPPTNYIHSE